METRTHRHHWGVTLMSLLALGFLAWSFFSSRSEVPLEPPEPSELMARAAAPVAPPTRSLPPQKKTASVDFSPGGVPIRPPGSDELNAVGMLPHPLSPEHERIFRENNLIGDLNGAMDVADVAGLLRLLKQYREEYPEDSHVLQDGYELIANCLDRPGAETRATAQRYYDEELASGLRRYIRRHCLEASNP